MSSSLEQTIAGIGIIVALFVASLIVVTAALAKANSALAQFQANQAKAETEAQN